MSTWIGWPTWKSRRRDLLQQVQELNRQANEVSKSIGKAAHAEEREQRKEEGRRLRDEKDRVQREHDLLDGAILTAQRTIPNLSHPDAPRGSDESANKELRRGATPPRTFDFKPEDHVALGERLDLIDLEGGARTTGHGFYFVKNQAVLLDLALQQFVLNLLVEEGFTPMITPDLARQEVVEGIGFIPRGPESQIYTIDDSEWCLIATAEITLGGLYAGHTFDADDLPLKLCGVSHCYRREGGCAWTSHAGTVSRAPVYQSGNVCLHASGSERADARCILRFGMPYLRCLGNPLPRRRHGDR